MRTDVVVVGGGVTGSAAAGFLRQQPGAPDVVVLEPDPSYQKAASPRASGGIRQLFSCPENIAMSRYTREVIEQWDEFSGEQAPGLGWKQNGYLFLCGEAEAGQLAYPPVQPGNAA